MTQSTGLDSSIFSVQGRDLRGCIQLIKYTECRLPAVTLMYFVRLASSALGSSGTQDQSLSSCTLLIQATRRYIRGQKKLEHVTNWSKCQASAHSGFLCPRLCLRCGSVLTIGESVHTPDTSPCIFHKMCHMMRMTRLVCTQSTVPCTSLNYIGSSVYRGQYLPSLYTGTETKLKRSFHSLDVGYFAASPQK